MFKTRTFILSLFAIFLAPQIVKAAIMVTGTLPGGPVSLEVTEAIVVPITSTGDIRYFVFDEWVTSDGASDPSFDIASVFTYSISGPSAGSGNISIGRIEDNFASGTPFGDITANDGILTLNSNISVVPGDTLTIPTQTWTLNTTPANYNPQVIQSFTGQVFLAENATGSALSSFTAVPEPSSLMLTCVALIFSRVLFLKRRV